MNKLRVKTFLSSLFLAAILYGQSEVQWAASIGNKGIITFIGEDQGYLYNLRQYWFTGYLEKTRLSDMELIYSEKLKIQSGESTAKIGVMAGVVKNGIISLFGAKREEGRDQYTLVVSSITTEGKIVKNWTSLGTYSGRFFYCEVAASPDKQHIICKVEAGPAEDKDTVTCQLIRFNSELEITGQTEVVLDYEGYHWKRTLKHLHVNNSGQVFALISGWQELAPISFEPYDPLKSGAETLISFDGTTQRRISLLENLNGKQLLNGRLTPDPSNNSVFISGHYTNQSMETKNLSGVYSGRYAFGDDKIQLSFIDLESSFIDDLIQEATDYKHKKDFSIFRDLKTIANAKGELLAIGEHVHYGYACSFTGPPQNETTCAYSAYRKSLFCIKISSSGELLWKHIIPKRSGQFSNDFTLVDQFVVRQDGEEADILFLDHPENCLGDARKEYKNLKSAKEKKYVIRRAHISASGSISYPETVKSNNGKILPHFGMGYYLTGDQVIIIGVKGINSIKACMGKVSLD